MLGDSRLWKNTRKKYPVTEWWSKYSSLVGNIMKNVKPSHEIINLIDHKKATRAKECDWRRDWNGICKKWEKGGAKRICNFTNVSFPSNSDSFPKRYSNIFHSRQFSLNGLKSKEALRSYSHDFIGNYNFIRKIETSWREYSWKCKPSYQFTKVEYACPRVRKNESGTESEILICSECMTSHRTICPRAKLNSAEIVESWIETGFILMAYLRDKINFRDNFGTMIRAGRSRWSLNNLHCSLGWLVYYERTDIEIALSRPQYCKHRMNIACQQFYGGMCSFPSREPFFNDPMITEEKNPQKSYAAFMVFYSVSEFMKLCFELHCCE